MIVILSDESAQLIGVAEGGERAINESDDFAEANLGRLTAELIPTFGAANAFDDASVLQFEQNEFQKFFGQIVINGNLADFNGAGAEAVAERHESFERVQAFLRDLQSRNPFDDVL